MKKADKIAIGIMAAATIAGGALGYSLGKDIQQEALDALSQPNLSEYAQHNYNSRAKLMPETFAVACAGTGFLSTAAAADVAIRVSDYIKKRRTYKDLEDEMTK